MKLLIDQLIVLDRAFYRYYLEMLLTLEHTHALTPWQMSILLWRAKIFHVEILYPELLRISIGNEQEKDEIRFMKMWKLKELEKVMTVWQRRQCQEIKRKKWKILARHSSMDICQGVSAWVCSRVSSISR